MEAKTTLPHLTPAELESLAVLIEEAGEALQAAGKMMRHGKQATDLSVDPPVAYDNQADLEEELGQVIAAIIIYQFVFDRSDGLIERATTRKLDRIGQRLNHIDMAVARRWFDSGGTRL